MAATTTCTAQRNGVAKEAIKIRRLTVVVPTKLRKGLPGLSNRSPAKRKQEQQQHSRGTEEKTKKDGGSSSSKRSGERYLSGNFGPVREEVYVDDLEVKGELPDCLEGVFMQVGPNPYYDPPPGVPYHVFDGDGMVHALALRRKGGSKDQEARRTEQGTAANVNSAPSSSSGGSDDAGGGRLVASYCNHYVRTARLARDWAVGYPAFSRLGSPVMVGLGAALGGSLALMRRALGALGPLPSWGRQGAWEGFGSANTALVAHAGRLLALHEADLPYELRVEPDTGRLRTLGRCDGDDNGDGDGVGGINGWAPPREGGRAAMGAASGGGGGNGRRRRAAGLKEMMGHAVGAHPKLDPRTGELLLFNYRLVGSTPGCRVGFLDRWGRPVAQAQNSTKPNQQQQQQQQQEGKRQGGASKEGDDVSVGGGGPGGAKGGGSGNGGGGGCGVSVSLRQRVMMHDVGLARDYVVLLDCPMVFDPMALMRGSSVPFVFDKQRRTRFGLLPRGAADGSEVRWFEAPWSNMIMHVANAFQEEKEDGGQLLHLLVTAHEQFDLELEEGYNEQHGGLQRITIDPATGEVARTVLTQGLGEFPTINPRFAGSPSRYAYVALAQPDEQGDYVGIAKVDTSISRMGLPSVLSAAAAAASPLKAGSFPASLAAWVASALRLPAPSLPAARHPQQQQQAVVKRLRYGPGCYGREAYFVPRRNSGRDNRGNGGGGTMAGRPQAPPPPQQQQDKEKEEQQQQQQQQEEEEEQQEDDGYLVAFVHDVPRGRSSVRVYDASTMSEEPVAVVQLPQRVPYGFHTLHATWDELSNGA